MKQRLLQFCCHHGLSITNTFFENKPCHKVSWRHPRSGHWHLLDLVITRRNALNNVLNTRSYHSADFDTDHSLICARVRMQPKRLFHFRQKGHIRINISNTTYPEKNQQFRIRIRIRIIYLVIFIIIYLVANNYWLQLCQSIQTSSDTGNIRGMYDGIKKATGPTMKKTAQLKQHQERSSPSPINKWKDGWNTTLSCTPQKILSQIRHYVPSTTCLL